MLLATESNSTTTSQRRSVVDRLVPHPASKADFGFGHCQTGHIANKDRRILIDEFTAVLMQSILSSIFDLALIALTLFLLLALHDNVEIPTTMGVFIKTGWTKLVSA